jgi:hypothetical protein
MLAVRIDVIEDTYKPTFHHVYDYWIKIASRNGFPRPGLLEDT